MAGEIQVQAQAARWRSFALRILVLFAALFAVLAGSELIPDLALHSHPGWPRLPVRAAGSALLCVAMIVTYRLMVRWTEKRNADEIGATRALPLFVTGLALGVTLFCAVYAVLYAWGAVAFAGIRVGPGVGVAATVSLGAGVGEEIIFRGVLYRIFEERFGTMAALLSSAAVFGLMHAFNPGATWESTLAVALEAGVLLGAAYALARSLWLPIGLHFGWNFAEGGIFSAAVSGANSQGLISAKLSGPASLTGGVFGPEASIEAVAVCLIASAVILALAIRRGQWIALQPRPGNLDKPSH